VRGHSKGRNHLLWSEIDILWSVTQGRCGQLALDQGYTIISAALNTEDSIGGFEIFDVKAESSTKRLLKTPAKSL
jgi:hypothetical protein